LPKFIRHESIFSHINKPSHPKKQSPFCKTVTVLFIRYRLNLADSSGRHLVATAALAVVVALAGAVAGVAKVGVAAKAGVAAGVGASVYGVCGAFCIFGDDGASGRAGQPAFLPGCQQP
jgi:hypothetical protein